MEDFIKKISEQLRDFFFSLDLSRRLGLIFLTLAVIVFTAVALIWAGKTRYKVLYTDLNKEDSVQVSRILEENGIAYQLAADGKTIQIPEDQVDIWRLELAKKGVRFTGTVGYEIFDKQSFGTTSFVQKVNKQRALEGELIKTIMHINGVKRARVHLSIPEVSPFVSEKKPPSASVVLELQRGVVMTAQEIRGIGSLVSAAVDGMRQEHVIIVDHRGKKLSDNIGDKMTADTANRIALEARMNRQYEQQIEEILSKVVGEGRVIAKVAVSLDFTESVATETIYDGENAAVLSEVKNKQILDGSRPSPQGIPGARSNLPGETPQPGIPETKNKVDKDLITKNYNVPSKVIKSKKPTATISKLTAAVMVDGKQINVMGKDGKQIFDEIGIPQTKYEPWSDQDLGSFKEIIASSIGLSDVRGDKLTIRNMEFAKEDLATVEALMREREKREVIRNLVKYLTVGLAISLFFFFVVRPFIKWVTENTIESVEDFLPRTLEELEKIQANQKLPGLEDALPQIEEKLNPEKVEGNMLREKIVSLVEQNPAKAAQVLHEMIHSGDSNKDIA